MEITFYDKTGRPVVYLSPENENSIYTWDGHAVAYLHDGKIYGWKGKHIGWYIDSVLYDLNGHKVGSTRERCPYATYAEYAKYAKYARYARYARYAAYLKPVISSSYSDVKLIDFITQDKI